MVICELCTLRSSDETCNLGNKIPKSLRCADFKPGVERFCNNPTDYTGRKQVYQMAVFFGLKGKELKRVQAM